MPTDFNIPSFVIGFACALSCVAIYHVHSAPSHSAKLKQHEKLSSLKPSDFPNDMQIPTKTLHASDKEYRSALVSSKKQVQIASSPSSILISTVQSSLVKPRQKITDIGYYARDVEPVSFMFIPNCIRLCNFHLFDDIAQPKQSVVAGFTI